MRQPLAFRALWRACFDRSTSAPGSAGGVAGNRPARDVRGGLRLASARSSRVRRGGVQRPRCRDVQRRVAVIPVDPVPRRGVLAQHLANGAGACAGLGRPATRLSLDRRPRRSSAPSFACYSTSVRARTGGGGSCSACCACAAPARQDRHQVGSRFLRSTYLGRCGARAARRGCRGGWACRRAVARSRSVSVSSLVF